MPRTQHPNLGRIGRLTSRINMSAVLEKIGVDIDYSRNWAGVSGWSSVLCPFHDDRNPSARFNDEKGKFQCFACDVHGSIVDVAMAHLRTEDIYEALAWLEKEWSEPLLPGEDIEPFRW